MQRQQAARKRRAAGHHRNGGSIHKLFMPLQILSRLQRLVATIKDKSMKKLYWHFRQKTTIIYVVIPYLLNHLNKLT